MKQGAVVQALKAMRDASKQRKFVQTVEMVVIFKNLNMKKNEHQIDLRVELPHATGMGSGKSLIFIRDKTFAFELKGKVDRIIMENEIEKLSKKDVAALAEEFDLLLAEGPVALTVGKFCGQVLAPKGKMPRPVPLNVHQVLEIVKSSSAATKVSNKKGKTLACVQAVIGKENMSDNDLADNAVALYNAVVNAVPRKTQSIKSVIFKPTMGAPVKVGEVE
ncbi:MAG: hypothetical protein HY394_02165 [Candidatus Diapherotrites archaeon]|nr:hypothetical protein [Candidatus Diapherotrites archaeon]